jgi:hypothetical protein
VHRRAPEGGAERNASVQTCVAALQKYPGQLGSGWSRVVLAVSIALRDRKLVVVEEGLAVLAASVEAADTAECFSQLEAALLGLCVCAATLEEQPHLCFSALNCIERMAEVLLRQQIGTSVRVGLSCSRCCRAEPLQTCAAPATPGAVQ